MVSDFPACTIFLMVPPGQGKAVEKRTEIGMAPPSAARIARLSALAWGAGG